MMDGGRPVKDKRLEEKPACSIKAAPCPAELDCSACGELIEVWSDEPEGKCGKCGLAVSNPGYSPVD